MFTTSIRRARPALQRAAALAWLAAPAPLAAAVPCAGGSIDFTHGSDTPQTGTLYNVGQRVMIAAQPVGITPTAWAWTVDGPAIADYDERVGTSPTGGVAWSTTPLGPAELGGPTL
ncbi:MAG TPA: hypothetical protein VFJ82_14250, partial [Longimicrobium sp.]|nr:hypothetical protein [Longimicrobium sp.]